MEGKSDGLMEDEGCCDKDGELLGIILDDGSSDKEGKADGFMDGILEGPIDDDGILEGSDDGALVVID